MPPRKDGLLDDVHLLDEGREGIGLVACMRDDLDVAKQRFEGTVNPSPNFSYKLRSPV